MNRLLSLRAEQLWALAAAAVLLLALLLGGGYLVRKHLWARETLASVDPRHARLAGLIQNQEHIAQIQQQLQANLTEYSYGSDRDAADIGNAVLQRVRNLADAHGLRVASSQVGTPKEDPEQGFDHIGLELRLEGNWAATLDLLRELATVRPAIFTEAAQFSASGGFVRGGQTANQTVTVQLGLFVLRRRP
ncbi:MAG: type II secretion system protein M [Burkholderiaceae bacterium]|jgi:general secretion pathway protein M|nr:type II secretion system protein M [Burkholderiaceae bacterium]